MKKSLKSTGIAPAVFFIRVNEKIKIVFKKLWRIAWKSTMWFFIISISSVILFRWVPVPVTPFMLTRCIEQKWDGKEMKLKKDWVSIDEISKYLQLAVVCSEDQNFIKHNGFDFDAIERAIDYNKTHNRKRGASTISQQTAKNVFLWQGRSWFRKGLEVYFTFLIETFWSKERIMEVYLNVIEFGDGIYGAEAASQEFYKRMANDISKEQAALLAAVLPNPRKFSAKNPGPYMQSRQQWVLNQMCLWGGVLDYRSEENEIKTN